jgi:hypothetical protein
MSVWKQCSVRLHSHLLCRFMLYLCYLYLFTLTGVQRDFYFRWCSCRLTVTQRVLIVGQELFNLPEHMSKPCSILSFCVVFCRFFFLLSFFVWSLHCLTFFDLRLLVTTLESSNVFHRLTFYDQWIIWQWCASVL